MEEGGAVMGLAPKGATVVEGNATPNVPIETGWVPYVRAVEVEK